MTNDIDEMVGMGGGLGERTRNALANRGARNLTDVQALSEREFLALPNVGRTCLLFLNDWLQSKGLSALKSRHCPTCTCND